MNKYIIAAIVIVLFTGFMAWNCLFSPWSKIDYSSYDKYIVNSSEVTND